MFKQKLAAGVAGLLNSPDKRWLLHYVMKCTDTKFYKTGCPIKEVLIKTFNWICSGLQFTVFEFIWIQYICKFCLVYHLIDLVKLQQFFGDVCVFQACKFSRKTAIKTNFNYCSSGSGQNSVIPVVCDVPE